MSADSATARMAEPMVVRPKRYATSAIATAATPMVSRLCVGIAASPNETDPSTRLGKSCGWSPQIVLMTLSAMSETRHGHHQRREQLPVGQWPDDRLAGDQADRRRDDDRRSGGQDERQSPVVQRQCRVQPDVARLARAKFTTSVAR